VKGSWTREEDETIVRFVQENGVKDWIRLATLLPGRLGKQCRERWRNHLDPDMNRDPWTEEEDQLLIHWHTQVGSKWVKIAEFLPGRTDNAIKNRWNSTLSKRIQYEQAGLPRPKRGRPPKRPLAERAPVLARPHPADDGPECHIFSKPSPVAELELVAAKIAEFFAKEMPSGFGRFVIHISECAEGSLNSGSVRGECVILMGPNSQ
jgi:hypothetical protein